MNENLKGCEGAPASECHWGKSQAKHSSEEEPKWQTRRKLDLTGSILCWFFSACGWRINSGKAKLYWVYYVLSGSYSGNYPGFGEFVEVKLLKEIPKAGIWWSQLPEEHQCVFSIFSLPTNLWNTAFLLLFWCLCLSLFCCKYTALPPTKYK